MTYSKKINIIVSAFIFTLLLVAPQTTFAFENWWQCQSRMGGEWNFARTPSVCLVDHMLTQSFVKDQYKPLIFNDSASRSAERIRYMNELNAVANEVAEYYLKKRKPNVSQSEINAFTLGLQALMHQETFWSHYRKNTDGKVRYMRGDVGHGHGVMQVDDRSHQTALLESKGADLIKNMMYGLDVFYSAWQKAASASCVSSPTNFKNRIRSAWAAYNGGPSRICRWTSTTGTFAHHDKDFLSKLNGKAWNKLITKPDLALSLNIHCLAEGNSPCSDPIVTPPVQNPVANTLYKTSSGSYCVLKSNRFECVDRLDDVNCLQLREDRLFGGASNLTQAAESQFEKVNLDRSQLCLDNVDGLIPLTAQIKVLKNINLRKTPGGVLLRTVASGNEFQITDFRVLSTQDQKRYYKISYKGNSGYIYGGDVSSYETWIEPVEVTKPESLVAAVGETIQINAPNGINLRKTPGGTLIGKVSTGDLYKVVDVITQGSKNYLYYKVSQSSGDGYIYSGYLDDMTTINFWTQKVKDDDQVLYQLSDSLVYRVLRSCGSADCSFKDAVILSEASFGQQVSKLFLIEQKNGWSFVESEDRAKNGWVLSSELQQSKK